MNDIDLRIILKKNISKYRCLSNKSKKNLADEIGVTVSTLSKWEKGITKPTIPKLPRLASALSIQIQDLFEDKDK